MKQIELNKKLATFKTFKSITIESVEEYIVQEYKMYGDDFINSITDLGLVVIDFLLRNCYGKLKHHIIKVEEVITNFVNVVKTFKIPIQDKLKIIGIIEKVLTECIKINESAEQYEVCGLALQYQQITTVLKNNYQLYGK